LIIRQREGPKSLKDLLGNWRVRISAIVIAFNIEIVVIPVILIGILRLSGSVLRNVSSIWATVEMCWWVYFSGWVPKEAAKIKQVAEAIELGKEVGPEFVSEAKDTDSARKVEEFVAGYTLGKFDFEKWKDSWFVSALKFLGYTFGCLFILFISAIPFPGIWIPGLAICRKNDWKLGYAALFIGNFAKNYLFAVIWEYIWPYRPYIFGVLFVAIIYLFVYKSRNSLTWKDIFFKISGQFTKKPESHR